ncbi:MAG: prenyltransferase [Methanocella sp. PtaU1.Bin125]|nr:MAG: prenyltransferase [Methanocella sp. PtaU1.Bin125]
MEFSHGGHATALILPSVILAFGLVRGDPVDPLLLAIAYLIPLVIYAYDYYRELDRDRLTQPERAGYLKKKGRIYPYLISGYVASLSALIVLYGRCLPELAAMIGVLLGAGMLYTAFLKRMTRFVPGFKSFYVTGVWVLAIALMYIIYSGRRPEALLPVLVCFMFIKLATNAVFYDLRDIGADGRDGLKTIPVVLGWRRTIQLLYLLCLLSPVPLLAGMLAGAVPGGAMALLAFTAYDLGFVRLAETKGEAGMAARHYAVADFEFLPWPAAVAACLWLLDVYGPAPTAALMALAVGGSVLLAWLLLGPSNLAEGRG